VENLGLFPRSVLGPFRRLARIGDGDPGLSSKAGIFSTCGKDIPAAWDSGVTHNAGMADRCLREKLIYLTIMEKVPNFLVSSIGYAKLSTIGRMWKILGVAPQILLSTAPITSFLFLFLLLIRGKHSRRQTWAIFWREPILG
jgi:hypothetical protein